MRGEGDTGIDGGDDPNDNSGSLRYVRVEFAGVEFSPDNELNGIAFQAVGRGGLVRLPSGHMNRDDAFEWFGGTADIKHAIASNAADDSFDWTFGWTGRAQFVAIHQRGDDADSGIEADNSEFNNNALPRSNPQLYNFTMCGDPDRNEGGEASIAATIPARHGIHAQKFPDHRLQDIRYPDRNTNTATTGQIDNGTTQMSNGVIWNIGITGGAAGTAMHSSVTPLRQQRPLPERSRECGRRPVTGLLRVTKTRTSSRRRWPRWPADNWRPRFQPNDGFFEAVTYIGAVPPAPEDDWTQGWTAYPQR